MNSAIASRKPPPVIFPMPAEHDRRRAREEVERELARRLERLDEPAHRRRVERLDEPLGGVEEVERVGGGRRVEDDEVEARVALHGDELLHRHVLLRARERGRDVLVELVVEELLRAFSGVDECLMTSSSKVRFVSSIIAVSDPVSGQPAGREARRCRSSCASVDIRSSPRLSASRRAGSMVRHEHAPPALRRRDAERRRGRRLAHPAGARP